MTSEKQTGTSSTTTAGPTAIRSRTSSPSSCARRTADRSKVRILDLGCARLERDHRASSRAALRLLRRPPAKAIEIAHEHRCASARASNNASDAAFDALPWPNDFFDGVIDRGALVCNCRADLVELLGEVKRAPGDACAILHEDSSVRTTGESLGDGARQLPGPARGRGRPALHERRRRTGPVQRVQHRGHRDRDPSLGVRASGTRRRRPGPCSKSTPSTFRPLGGLQETVLGRPQHPEARARAELLRKDLPRPMNSADATSRYAGGNGRGARVEHGQASIEALRAEFPHRLRETPALGCLWYVGGNLSVGSGLGVERPNARDGLPPRLRRLRRHRDGASVLQSATSPPRAGRGMYGCI